MPTVRCKHRPGPSKQQNKPHKHSGHKSRGKEAQTDTGRISVKSSTSRKTQEMRRKDRKNQMQQIRGNKRHEILMKKRQIGIGDSPPHLIVVVPLSQSIDAMAVSSLLCRVSEDQMDEDGTNASTRNFLIKNLKQRFTVVTPSSSDLYQVLHVAMVANTVMFVYDGATAAVDKFGELCISATKSQGLPSTCHVVTGLSELSGKKLHSAKKAVSKLVENHFPGNKLLNLDTDQDADGVLRVISQQKQSPVKYRDTHPHLLVDSLSFAEQSGGVGTLRVTGYIRGRALSVNGLVHLPNYGAFQMLQIDEAADPCRLKAVHIHTKADDMLTDQPASPGGVVEGVRVLERADPKLQESLLSEVIPDPMEGEQTWPTDEELKEAEELQVSATKKTVSKGTSSYQATWIHDDDDDDSEGAEEGEDSDLDNAEETSDENDSMDLGFEGPSAGETDRVTFADEEAYDETIDVDIERKQREMWRVALDDEMFPDEIDTPRDVPAKDRFAKYRGLENFRTSLWDRKESLPSEYARIFQFDNFAQTKKKVLNARKDQGTPPGRYITIHIDKVPSKCYAELLPFLSPLVVFGLLPHENKMSLVHFTLHMTDCATLPLKSKDRLIFHVGARIFTACPTFSQHAPGDKQKYERFFRSQDTVVASLYCPIAYPPTPVLVFSDDLNKDGKLQHTLVAAGSVFKVDPDRVVLKKVMLSGHPFKINKRSSVVRYMFFNRDDIMWFKPVELKTKHGCRGIIKEPLGTHGHMKCFFTNQLKAQDTVLMPLYKRVYPKWSYSLEVDRPDVWIASATSQDNVEEMGD